MYLPFINACINVLAFASTQEWMLRKPSCPICRAPIWTLSVDYEFARAVGCEMTAPTRLTAVADADDVDNGRFAEAGADLAPERLAEGNQMFTVAHPPGITLTASSEHLVAARSVIVVRVNKGDGAERIGIKKGDIIVSVNGREVHTHEMAINLIDTFSRTGTCNVLVKRTKRRWPATMSGGLF